MATRKKTKADQVAAMAAIKDTDVQQVVATIGETQATVQGLFAGLGVTLTKKIEELDNFDTAIEAKSIALKELHAIEGEMATLEALKERREEEIAEDLRLRALRRQSWSDDEATRQNVWDRTVEQQEFDHEQRKMRFEAELAEHTRSAQQTESYRKNDVQRALDVKSAELIDRETKIEDLEGKVAEFPETLKKEVGKEVGKATSTLKRDHDHATAMLQKDVESNQQLAAARIKALEESLASATRQISSLEEKADDADKRASDLATAAVTAAGQREALDTLKTQAITPSVKGR